MKVEDIKKITQKIKELKDKVKGELNTEEKRRKEWLKKGE